MTVTDLQKNTVLLQRVLKADGLYTGKVDGIHGPKTAAALKEWLAQSEALWAAQPVPDARTEGNLRTCTLTLQRILRPWLLAKVFPWAKAHGYHAVRVISALRSDAEQNAIGSAYTNAKGGSSYHNYGLAVDLGIFGKNDTDYLGNDDRPYIALQRECGTPACCIWGGTFTKRDYPHYQIDRWGATISPLKRYMQA